MSNPTDLRALPNVLGPLTNKPLFFSFISFDISVTTLLSQYRIARRDNTGRLRQFQQANELQQEVNSLRTELDFLIQTQRSLTQQPTLQASPSPPVVSQNYTPPRCRLPSDMPRFKRPTAEAQSTVQDFISVFERKLKTDSYPTEKYVAALTACCHLEEADWVESNITHCQSWDEAKDRFLRHFIDKDMETLYAYKLEGILKNPKEFIHAFADHYLHAMRLAKADPNLKHVQVTHFLTRLSDQVRKDINLVKATRPENVDTVSGIVKILVTLYPPTKVSVKPGNPTQALRWCSYHRSPAHSDEECQAQKRSGFHRPPATAKSGSTSKARGISTWCKHHKVNTHSTSECRLTNPSSTNATLSRVFPKSMLATSSATYAPTSQRCHRCNKVGHYANRCPKLTNAALVPTRHSSALVSNQSSNQNGFTKSYQEPEAESKDPTVEDFYELFSKRPSNHLSQSLSEQTGIDYNSAFLVPIIFESVQLSAYIDSGASHSSVPKTLIHPDWVALTYRSHGTTRSSPINSKSVIRQQESRSSSAGTCLPTRHHNIRSTITTACQQTCRRRVITAHVHDRRRYQRSSSGKSSYELTEAIQRNQAIPSNSFCNVPVAVVRLETGDHPPVYRRQYPIPFNVHDQVKEQIEEWVQTDKCLSATVVGGGSGMSYIDRSDYPQTLWREVGYLGENHCANCTTMFMATKARWDTEGDSSASRSRGWMLDDIEPGTVKRNFEEVMQVSEMAQSLVFLTIWRIAGRLLLILATLTARICRDSGGGGLLVEAGLDGDVGSFAEYASGFACFGARGAG
ncbi:hypothetical protein BASA50_008623 [Batrachochytrium salamandrivorans]|uniref:CCHC-type domain-containing protein n=1 Tax=Batrachochytrium salamandrivorans TaxID=1357716 RepID=A0ABQ8F3K7_9FUNG|nr:hypothetical protein BASA50_008623 [Batrachochytrium salamandrivorans]